MDNLSPAERDLLARIDAKEELRPFFFRKVKGLKWFNALDERNYFEPAGNPAPVSTGEEKRVYIPHWPVTHYLVATSPELLIEKNRIFAERVLEIIRAVTDRAREKSFSNYQTWWQFSKIIQNIPVELITAEDLERVDYWLDDPYHSDMIAKELGEIWLVKLLEKASNETKDLALRLLKRLYKASFSTEALGDTEYQEAVFRFDKWRAQEITKAVAGRSGKVIGAPAVHVFLHELERVLKALGKRDWSCLWRAAVEEHSQNLVAYYVEGFLVSGLRDSLGAWVKEAPEESRYFVTELLQNSLQICRRIAIYTINQNYEELSALIESVVIKDNFEDDIRHEMWHLLHDRYPSFPEPIKKQVRKTIGQLTRQIEEGALNKKAAAYTQAIWLSAIKRHEETLQNQYQACIELTGSEPDHPDFPVYRHCGLVKHVSPKNSEELLSMDIDELIKFLDEYKNPEYVKPGLEEIGIEGLVDALQDTIKMAPLKFTPSLQKFTALDSAYVYGLIKAFSELWKDNKALPWDDVWPSLLDFCRAVIQQEAFWSPENVKQRSLFVANRHWVVDGIGQLIKAGVESDEHAFSPKLLSQARELIFTLLEKQSGEEFKPGSDAVSTAIGSPRGKCLEALINIALRCCRLADKTNHDHAAVWQDFQPIFEAELARADTGEYEFITLLVMYLSNFLYMSPEWVLNNLDRIFDRGNYQKWLCAMQAYRYFNYVYEKIYNHLKINQHFIHALDDEHLKYRILENIIKNIVIAYLHGQENLDSGDSLMQILLDRARHKELGQLIWCIYELREEKDQNLHDRVMVLWPRLLKVIDMDNQERRKLASELTVWLVFITRVDDTNRDWILETVRHIGEDDKTWKLLEAIARISAGQPEEAVAIWRAMLKNSAPDYPEDAIRKIFANLVNSGHDGRRAALAIADEYFKRGNEGPNFVLKEVLKTRGGG